MTVVLPVLNGGSLLNDAIKSVLSQMYENIELLIVDDGSTDDTVQLIRGHRDSRIRLIRHETNTGFVVNWTYGVETARGRYISYWDRMTDTNPVFWREGRKHSTVSHGFLLLPELSC